MRLCAFERETLLLQRCLDANLGTFREDLSRKDAKAQSAAAFLRVFFASLRLCARRIFPAKAFQRGLSTLRAKSADLFAPIPL